jgi:O-antigen ligase
MAKGLKATRQLKGSHLKVVAKNNSQKNFWVGFRELGFNKIAFLTFTFAMPLMMTIYFNDPFTVVKWLWLYVLGSALLIRQLFQGKPFELPRLSRFAWVCTFALGAVWFLNYFIQDVNPIQAPTLERALFVIIGVFAFQCFSSEDSPRVFTIPVVLSSFPFLIWAANQFSDCQTGVIRPDVDQSCFAGAFGNSNMSAEFLAVALACQADTIARTQHKWLKYFTSALLAPTMMCIFLYQSRSVILGSSGLILFLLLFRNHVSRKLVLGSIVAAAVGVMGVSRLQSQGFQIADKSHSTNTRGLLYLDTLDLIKDKPWGLGLSMYEFGVQPYRYMGRSPVQEHEVFKTPHSEPLRFAAQDGLQYLILVLILAFLCARNWLRKRGEISRIDNLFLFGFAIVMTPEILFQFALENAFPFLAVCTVLAYGFSRLYKVPEQTLSIQPKFPFRAAFALLITVFSLDLIVSRYLEANYQRDAGMSYLACQLEPLNWRACFNSARFDIEAGRHELASQHLTAELIKRPYNYAALNLWSLVQFKTGRLDRGCQTLNFYDALFDGQSRQHNFYFATCPATPSYNKSNLLPEYDKFMKRNIYP